MDEIIDCELEEIELDGDCGMVPSVRVSCGRCGHSTESYGTGENSIKRCCALLREECPEDEYNFYTVEE